MRPKLRINDIFYATVVELSEALDTRSIKVEELASSFLDRTKSLNVECKAYIEFFEVSAMKNAKKLDEESGGFFYYMLLFKGKPFKNPNNSLFQNTKKYNFVYISVATM